MLDSKYRKIKRIRNKISGADVRPRLSVYRTLKNISAQLIDDKKGITICAASSIEIKNEKNKIKIAKAVGKLLAKKALDMKIGCAVFDRRNYRYHGRIKALADGAREEGLKI